MTTMREDVWNYKETLEKEDAEYEGWHEAAVLCLKEVTDIVQSKDFAEKTGWALEAENKEHDYKVYSKSGVQKRGKTFVGLADYHVPFEVMWDDIWGDLSGVPEWNPDLLEYRSLLKVGAQTELSYHCFKDQGVISKRDFVLVRTWRQLPSGARVIGQASAKYAGCPAQKGRVRGEDAPGIMLLEKHPEKEGWLRFTYSSNTDLKGFLPKALTDKVIHTTLMDYLVRLGQHLEEKAKAKQ